MELITSVIEKHEKYTFLFSKLKKAMDNDFYLEAIFIEYAILEDRIFSMMCLCGNYDIEKYKDLSTKVSELFALSKQPTRRMSEYIPESLITALRVWMKLRNRLIHAFAKIRCTNEEVKQVAIEGLSLAKRVSNISTAYKRLKNS